MTKSYDKEICPGDDKGNLLGQRKTWKALKTLSFLNLKISSDNNLITEL